MEAERNKRETNRRHRGSDAMEEVAGDAAVDGDTPCRLETGHRQHHGIESRRNAAISVQPLRWRRLGGSFIQGNGDDEALPVVQVKTAVWEWRWRERRGEHRGSSLEVEDGVAKLAGPRDR